MSFCIFPFLLSNFLFMDVLTTLYTHLARAQTWQLEWNMKIPWINLHTFLLGSGKDRCRRFIHVALLFNYMDPFQKAVTHDEDVIYLFIHLWISNGVWLPDGRGEGIRVLAHLWITSSYLTRCGCLFHSNVKIINGDDLMILRRIEGPPLMNLKPLCETSGQTVGFLLAMEASASQVCHRLFR